MGWIGCVRCEKIQCDFVAQTFAPDLPIFHQVLRPFGCLAKLVSKRSELVQKLVPRSRVGIFRNESTRSNPWDPKLIVSEFSTMKAPDLTHGTLNSCFGAFRTIWMHLGPLGCLTKLGAKRAELVQKFVPRSRIGIFRENAQDPPHMTLNSCFGVIRTIWVHLGPLGCLTKLGAKRAECAKVRATKSRQYFS